MIGLKESDWIGWMIGIAVLIQGIIHISPMAMEESKIIVLYFLILLFIQYIVVLIIKVLITLWCAKKM